MTDNLRGHPFISTHDEEGLSRNCENCFYGVKEAPTGIKYTGKCLNPEPLLYFNSSPLPSVLDGKIVAHYCPSFSDYTNHEEI